MLLQDSGVRGDRKSMGIVAATLPKLECIAGLRWINNSQAKGSDQVAVSRKEFKGRKKKREGEILFERGRRRRGVVQDEYTGM